jgi:surface antigen
MVERIETGGLMAFDYSKSDTAEISEEDKNEIAEAYKKAEERKARAKKMKWVWTLIAVLMIVLLTVGFVIY